jgi:hypothetical protein
MDRRPSERDGEIAPGVGQTVAQTRAEPSTAVRRAWTTPQLATHESLTVMTQHFFGPAGVAFALQINCGVSGKKFGC